ncbi:MAG: class I tRNA ligase family protein [Candidatus Bathyarchaeota archaeon]|nr:class I tRNA ligase family protein [Candidatus Bathyarchaeum sp.]
MLKLYNSLTRRLEPFEPLEDGNVKLVTCGPSIYQLPHIGNYRTFVFEDILHRYLEYLGYKVQRVLTITDVEDKALYEAKKQNIPLQELTDRNVKHFVEELNKLKVKIPDYLQRSSDTVEQAASLIEILLQKGYAYWHTHEGRKNVYFDPLKFDGFGKLFRLDMSKWPKQKIRFHKDTYHGNRWNRGDFILWHGYKEGDKVYWDTKIGKGRPSWNIQDPAMIPEEFNFKADIWCSGIDSTYRHHDYIIALVESLTDKPVVNYWLHADHLIFEGEKMSKRKGNLKYPRDLLETECVWNHIRFFFIYGHYRRKLNFAFKDYNKVCKLLRSFRKMVKNLKVDENSGHKSSATSKELVKKIKTTFEEHMNDDLQVKAAFDSLYKTVSRLVSLKEKQMLSAKDSKEALEQLEAIDYVFQAIF